MAENLLQGQSQLPLRESGHRGWLRLAAACGTLAVVWLVLLPWVAARPAQRARWEWLEGQGIDPSAMYYTELPMMEQVLERLESPSRKTGVPERNATPGG